MDDNFRAKTKRRYSQNPARPASDIAACMHEVGCLCLNAKCMSTRKQVGVHAAKTDWSRRILDFQYTDYDDQAAHHACVSGLLGCSVGS